MLHRIGDESASSSESERLICQTVGTIGATIHKLLVEGGGQGWSVAEEVGEEVFFSLLTMESNQEKLMIEGGEGLITRVDVSRSLDSLEYVLAHCQAGDGGVVKGMSF